MVAERQAWRVAKARLGFGGWGGFGLAEVIGDAEFGFDAVGEGDGIFAGLCGSGIAFVIVAVTGMGEVEDEFAEVIGRHEELSHEKQSTRGGAGGMMPDNMTAWTHCVAEIFRSKLESTLEEWGDKGWDLVSLVLLPPPAGNQAGEHLFLAVFKKQQA